MRLLGRLNLGQRVLIVITLGILLYLLGAWIATLGNRFYGWVAYTPLTGASPSPSGLTGREMILVWAFLALVWCGLSLVVLRSPSRTRDEDSAGRA
jgi:hypothetical protein